MNNNANCFENRTYYNTILFILLLYIFSDWSNEKSINIIINLDRYFYIQKNNYSYLLFLTVMLEQLLLDYTCFPEPTDVTYNNNNVPCINLLSYLTEYICRSRLYLFIRAFIRYLYYTGAPSRSRLRCL